MLFVDDGAAGTVEGIESDSPGLGGTAVDSVIPDVGRGAGVVLDLRDIPDPLTGACGTTFGNFGI